MGLLKGLRVLSSFYRFEGFSHLIGFEGVWSFIGLEVFQSFFLFRWYFGNF